MREAAHASWCLRMRSTWNIGLLGHCNSLQRETRFLSASVSQTEDGVGLLQGLPLQFQA